MEIKGRTFQIRLDLPDTYLSMMNQSLLFLSILVLQASIALGAPPFSKILRTIESQPLQDGELVYWDQSVADALGVQVPPGRIGQAAFNRAVVSQLGFEIKQGASVVANVGGASHDKSGHPYLFIEADAHGGSGRAGYIEVEPNVFVNIKGIGITGLGKTSKSVRGEPMPPLKRFSSHKDGSATLEEAIKEAISARVADSEFSHGASRVLAIIYTGRTITYPDGRSVPLAEIVRAPLRRFDQRGGKKSEVLASLAEANAKRVIKGDLVNKSNIGSAGEWVDFGCMSFTCGYAPLASSQNEDFLYEGRTVAKDDQLYTRFLGEHLLMQMGIPESYVRALGPDSAVKASKALESLGRDFRDAVYWEDDEISVKKSKLDFNPVDEGKLLGNIHFHEFFKEAAFRYFTTPVSDQGKLVVNETDRLLSLTQKVTPKLKEHLKKFVGELNELFAQVKTSNDIEDPEKFGRQVKEVAYFQNRSLPEFDRPHVFSGAGSVANQFAQSHDPALVQNFIDDVVQRNRFGTVGTSEPSMIIRETPNATQYYMRAFEASDGTAKLFAYPDLPGASKGKDMYFRISTDYGNNYRDYVASFVKTKVGEYFQVSVPHGDLRLTWEQVQLTPFLRNSDGSPSWLTEGLKIRGPPLVTNERLGLPPSFVRKSDVMRSSFGTLISLQPDDLVSDPKLIEGRPIQELLKILVNDSSDQIPTSLYDDTRVELLKRKAEVVKLYQNNSEFKAQVDAGMARSPGNKQQIRTRMILERMVRGNALAECIATSIQALFSLNEI